MHIFGYCKVDEQLWDSDDAMGEKDSEAYRYKQQFAVSQSQVRRKDDCKKECCGYNESCPDNYVKKFNCHLIGTSIVDIST